jgi:exosome complex component RRP4
MSEKHERTIVIPGETIVSGDDYLPGEGTEKRGKEVVSVRYGLVDEANKLVKVIPLSGAYIPRRGNVVIGTIENITFNGWVVNIGATGSSFLPLSEFPKYLNKDELEDYLAIGDMVVAKILEVHRKATDLTVKARGLGGIDEGIILKVNSNKVPRVIGKEGSMINIIKEETGCNITVGQNGLIWISGETIEKELLAKKSILFIVEKSYVEGLTDKIKDWFTEEKNKK